MLVSKFSAAFAPVLFVVPRARAHALAQIETRLPEVDVSATRKGAQGYSPLVTSTGAKTATPLREPVASMVAIPKEMLRAQSALPLDDAIPYASSFSMFDLSPLPPCAPRFLPIPNGVDHAICTQPRFDC